jgi:hypothetical protein
VTLIKSFRCQCVPHACQVPFDDYRHVKTFLANATHPRRNGKRGPLVCVECMHLNYVFSKLGRFIKEVQMAYFTADPSRPLANGLKNLTQTVCLSSSKRRKRSPIIHFGTYHLIAEIQLLFPVLININREKGFAEIDHTNDPDFMEQ